MSEPDQPHDPGTQDSAETDPAGLSAAQDLDEDQLQTDPLEAGMDPPEHWSGVNKYGMTPREEAEPRPLDERLAEELPDRATEAAQHNLEAADEATTPSGETFREA
ncbi:hypothetical protein AB0F91_37115 [Amycolatopsis sp. NPDC023774]|uniref:hypothetical protein n=1 Tax=Amycolatopsis sp. NPDC023774 TaxID=3155015 RepID=UPI0034008145